MSVQIIMEVVIVNVKIALAVSNVPAPMVKFLPQIKELVKVSHLMSLCQECHDEKSMQGRLMLK